MNLSRRIAVLGLVMLASPSLAQSPIGRSMSFDAGALGYREIRISVEPAQVGHFSFLASFSRSDDSRGGDLPDGVSTAPRVGPFSFDHVTGEEFSFDVGSRLYASAVRARRFSYAPYVGASIGAHQRTLSQWCFAQACPAIGFTTQASGFEPGGEAGIRFSAAHGLLLDVGVRARLVTFPDPIGNYQKGDVDPKLSVSFGFRW